MSARPRHAIPVLTFAVTYLVYAASYLARANAAAAKRSLASSLQLSDARLGVLDTCFLGTYTLGTALLGRVVDGCSPWRVLSLALLLSGFANGLAATLQHPDALALGYCYALNGVAQCLVYPAALTALRRAFARKGFLTVPALLTGLWCTSSSLGTCAGRQAATWLVQRTGSWRAAFAFPAMLCVALSCSLTALAPALAPAVASTPAGAPAGTPRRRASLALLTTGVLFGVAKLVRYFIALWLPYLLPRTAAAPSPALFDAGNLGGALLAGAVADILPGGSACSAQPLAALLFALLAAALTALHAALTQQEQAHLASGLLLIAGLASGGAEALTGPIATLQLAQPGGEASAAAVIGGIGAFGALVAAPLPAALGGDWAKVFTALASSAAAAAGMSAALAMTARRRRSSAARTKSE